MVVLLYKNNLTTHSDIAYYIIYIIENLDDFGYMEEVIEKDPYTVLALCLQDLPNNTYVVVFIEYQLWCVFFTIQFR